MASIKEKAVLVSLSVSCWLNQAKDGRVVDRLVKDTHAEAEVHRYKKVLIKPEALKQVRAAEGALRALWRDQSLPWGSDGVRILPSVKLQSFVEKARELEHDYDRAVSAFVAAYPKMEAEAKQRLASLYDPKDFPPALKIKDKFGCRLRFSPVPDKDDFRVKLSEDEKALLAKDVEAQVKESTRVAMQGLVERVHEALSHLSERMKEADPKQLRKSLVENVRVIVDDIDAFNLVDDKRITEIKKATAEVVKGLDLDALKEDKKARKAVASKADAVLAKMAGYIGGGAS